MLKVSVYKDTLQKAFYQVLSTSVIKGNQAMKYKKQDRVDVVQQKWRQERPALDVSAKGIVGRIIRLQAVMMDQVADLFSRHGIQPGEYAVLCNLRIQGNPYQLSPKGIAQSVLLTSGGLSNLLERLENKKYIKRLPDPQDRRGVLVQLQALGKKIIDAAMTEHVQFEAGLVSALNQSERATLENLLKKLLTNLEPV